VIVAGALVLGSQLLAVYAAVQGMGLHRGELGDLPPELTLLLILAGSAGSLVGMGVAVIWLRTASGVSWADLGIGPQPWLQNTWLGIVSFLLLMVPIFGLQFTLNWLYEYFGEPPPQHPLIKHLMDFPTGAGFAIAAFVAVIVAPLTEEFLFRLVFQGWLERVDRRWLRPSQPLYSEAHGGPEQLAPRARPLVLWPIFVSSAVFALMHFSHGVAWIPLFFFALALGYLYQRTGSLVPSIVLHVCLNGTTMLILWLATMSGL